MRNYMWLCFCLLLCLIGGIFFGSCAKRELTKTIVLEENEEEAAANEYVVKNIKEYFYEGKQREDGWIACEQDSDNIYALKYTDDCYEYQKIDIGQEKILWSIPMDMEEIGQVKIAPGGKFIAYEQKYAFGVELFLFSVEDESYVYIGESDEISFAWSGDGTKLFYTFVYGGVNDEDGTDYGMDTTWTLCCLEMEYYEEPHLIVHAYGDTGIAKNIVPNRDGSEIYVGYANTDEVADRQYWLFLIEDFVTQDEMKDAKSVAISQFGKTSADSTVISQRLLNIPEEITLPIRFTDAGLFALGENQKVFLITNLKGTSQISVVDEIDNEGIYVCENGDHLFVLKQEEGTKRFEVRILHLKGGKVVSNQLLYKDVSQNWADAVVSMDDHAIVLKSCEYFSEKKYSFKITLLEYGDR